MPGRLRSSGDSETTNYVYDGAGRIIQVTDPAGGDTTMTYDSAGRVTTKVLPNGITTAYAYDLRDQLISVVHSNAVGTVLRSVAYTRNVGGEPNRIEWQDGSYVLLSYDAALRLSREQFFTAGDVLSRDIEYGYDAGGNRTSREVDGVATTYSYAAGQRLAATAGGDVQSYSYDADGRTVAMSRGGVAIAADYNFEGQPTQVTTGGAAVD